ncbi:MAG: histidine kinase dimerization/phospho-acceptor domain-containing protein [Rhizomicrobium sp.]
MPKSIVVNAIQPGRTMALAFGAAAALAALFYVDFAFSPGAVAGLGYTVFVVAAARFGRRMLAAATSLCTALIVGPHFVLVLRGTGVTDDLVTRAFSVVAIWMMPILIDPRLAAGTGSASPERKRQSARETDKLVMIGNLSSRVAHDFNNSISAIMGFAGFLQESLPAGSEQHEFAMRILVAARRSTELIDQVRGISNLCSSDQSASDLASMLEETVKLVRKTLTSPVTLDVSNPFRAIIVACDSAQLGQLLFVLCMNAIGCGPGATVLSVAKVDGQDLVSSAAREAAIIGGEPTASLAYVRLEVNRFRQNDAALTVLRELIGASRGFAHLSAVPGNGLGISIYLPVAAGAPKSM